MHSEKVKKRKGERAQTTVLSPNKHKRPLATRNYCSLISISCRPVFLANMKNKLTTAEKKLYKRIAEILWEDWDPIGVNDGENDCDDEYDSYVPHIFRLVSEGKEPFRIAASLSSSVEQNMGLSANKQHDFNIASKIVAAKMDIVGK